MRISSPLRNNSLSLGLLALALLASLPLRADVVVLKNGDRLTGTAMKLEGGKLSFKTTYADVLAISWDEVATLTTNQPLVLPTGKQKLSVSALERSTTGMVVTTPTGPVTLPPTSVVVLRSAAEQQEYEASLHPSWARAWAGSANVNLALSEGNSQTITYGTGITLARPTRTDKTSLYASTLYSRDQHASLTTADTTAGGLRYDHNLKPTLFIFTTADFSSNGLQSLDLRSILGGGFGWHAVASPKTTLDVLGGLVWTHESYGANATATATTNSFAALDLGEQFTRKVGAASRFTEQLYIYPDMKDLGQYQLSFDSTFSTRIGKLFNWQTTYSDRYTSFPPVGSKGNDMVLSTGLGINLQRK